IRVASLAHLLLEAGDGIGSAAQIGHGGRQGSGNLIGTLEVEAVKDIGLLGGGLSATAQIGHGGFGFGGAVADQSILVESSAGALALTGGAGQSAGAHIGHGGFNALGLLFSGDVTVGVAGGIDLTGGTGRFAYS